MFGTQAIMADSECGVVLGLTAPPSLYEEIMMNRRNQKVGGQPLVRLYLN